MIFFLGDLHGRFPILQNIVDQFEHVDDKVSIIQVGDFGWYPNINPEGFYDFWDHWYSPIPVYFIDGNHENHDDLQQYKEVTELFPNLFYVPRGTILTIDGMDIGFLGGGMSPDVNVQCRRGGYKQTYFPNEEITEENVAGLLGQSVDLLVTHVPPASIRDKYMGDIPMDLRMFWKLPDDWVDRSMIKVEEVWHSMNRPPLVCGHMHRTLLAENCRILAECEFISHDLLFNNVIPPFDNHEITNV